MVPTLFVFNILRCGLGQPGKSDPAPVPLFA